MFGDWYWNPEARQVGVRSLPPENRIVPEDFIVRTVARHVNRPALIKYIRKNLGEKNWSSYVEIYGIPPVIIIMPPNVAKGREAEYEQAAADVASGGRGTLPNGTQVEFAGEARGSQPFKEYCDWIDGQMVMLGTGGLLTVLSMPQGMGSGSSGEHGDAFRQLARAESYRISEIFQRQLDKATLARLFPGKPALAYFEIAAREQNDPSKILTDAGLAKNAGFAMDADELSERTGYTLTEAAAPVPPPPMPPDAGGAALNSVPRRSSQGEAGAPPASPMEPILVELEGLLDDGDPDAIEAWIKTLPKKAADLDVGAVADPLARRMEAAAVAELEGRMKDLGRGRVVMNFDPGQPRDDMGRWSETGGGGMEWTSDTGTHHSYSEDTLTITPKGKSPIGLDATTEPKPLVERMAKKMKDAGRNPADYRTLSDKDGVHIPATELDRYGEARKRALAWKASPDAQRRKLEAEVSNQFVAGDHPTHPRRMKMAEAEKKLKEFDAANPDAVQRETEKKQKRLDKRAAEIKPGSPWTN
jgi:hypothetical protein